MDSENWDIKFILPLLKCLNFWNRVVKILNALILAMQLKTIIYFCLKFLSYEVPPVPMINVSSTETGTAFLSRMVPAIRRY